jgi:hypothetical protein
VESKVTIADDRTTKPLGCLKRSRRDCADYKGRSQARSNDRNVNLRIESTPSSEHPNPMSALKYGHHERPDAA